MPSVANLFRAPQRRLPMEELHAAEALADLGFAGCSHARRGGKRQVLLVDKETLDSMELQPGMIRENITTSGLNVNGLLPGERLRVGNRGGDEQRAEAESPESADAEQLVPQHGHIPFTSSRFGT